MLPVPNLTFFVILLWVVSAFFGIFGWYLGGCRRWLATAVSGLFCVILGLGIWCELHPSYIPDWMITNTAASLEGSWFCPFVMAIFFTAARQSLQRNSQKSSRRRVAFAGFAILGVLTFSLASIQLIQRLGWSTTDHLIEQDQVSVIDENGLVRQSLKYTCGPASCANLLRMLKIDPRATEPRLAPECLTKIQGGATPLGMAAALKAIAEPEGWKVKIMEPDWVELQKLKTPLICAVRNKRFVHHAVVVVEIDPDRNVHVADPNIGLGWWRFKEFKERFQNEVIVIYQGSPYKQPAQ